MTCRDVCMQGFLIHETVVWTCIVSCSLWTRIEKWEVGETIYSRTFWQISQPHSTENDETISSIVWFDFTWPLRKQTAYKQATRGLTALSLFRGTRQWGYSALPKGSTAAASRFEPGTSRLRVRGLIHWATTAPLGSRCCAYSCIQ